jgi:hypothetical protein
MLGALGLLLTSAAVAFSSLSAPLAGADPQPLVITTTSLPAATVDSPYSATLQATGGVAPYSWSWGADPDTKAEQLPPGLSFSAGTISGTPTQWGSFEFYVFVGDASNPQEQYVRTLVLNVQPLTPPPLVVTTTSLPNTTVGMAYSAALQASGGVPPYSWSIASGSLPEGLSLSSTGTISGTTELPQTSTFVVQVMDTGAQSGTNLYAPEQQTATEQLSIAVSSGSSSLDSTLESLGNTIVGAEGNATGELSVVTGLLGTLDGALSNLEQTISCLPAGLSTLLDGTPPACVP